MPKYSMARIHRFEVTFDFAWRCASRNNLLNSPRFGSIAETPEPLTPNRYEEEEIRANRLPSIERNVLRVGAIAICHRGEADSAKCRNSISVYPLETRAHRPSFSSSLFFPPNGENFLALIRASLEITNGEEVVETRVPGHDPTPTPSGHTARYQEE